MTDEAKAPKLYPHDEINAFPYGVGMDLRVRLALEFLKESPIFAPVPASTPAEKYFVSREPAGAVARYALELADELLKQADAKGLLTPISDDGKLTEALKGQARRNGAFQVYAQIGQNAAAQEEQSRVVPAAPIMKPGMH